MADWHGRHTIDALSLPSRAHNALVRAGITDLEDLIALDDVELLTIRGFGMASLVQVRERLEAWQRDHQPEEPEAPEKAPDVVDEPGIEYGPDAFSLLPGRQVLHASWIPDPSPHLFLWGEGAPWPPTGSRGPTSNLQLPIPNLQYLPIPSTFLQKHCGLCCQN
jgi:hypothetical protein